MQLLKGLRACLWKDKGLMIQYNNTFKVYSNNSVVEKVDTAAVNKELV